MKYVTPGALVAMLACQTISAQIPEAQLTHGTTNGRYWMTMSHVERISYVLGYSEAFAIYSDKQYSEQFPRGSLFGEIVTGVDNFYKSPENKIIPINLALIVYACKIRGFSASQIERLTDEFRRLSIAPANAIHSIPKIDPAPKPANLNP